MPTTIPDSKEIIKLLSTLKAETPDYPAEMLAARKASFLKQAVVVKTQIKGQGGNGGQSGGGGGAAAQGGSTTAPGIAFQALIGFGLVASMLIGALIFSKQNDDSHDKNVVTVEEFSDSTILPLTGGVLPTSTPVPTELIPATSTPDITTDNPIPSDETIFDEIEELKKEKKPNPGLHLGQADGTPAAPGQGNPGNINQPDKDKPDKPDKPGKPANPGKPE